MFDPTIFDNLKVVLEGAVYDLDFDGTVLVTARGDIIDLSVLSRLYRIRFMLRDQGHTNAEVHLSAGVEDLSAEILEIEGARPGCRLDIYFHLTVANPDKACDNMKKMLEGIWSPDHRITQHITYRHEVEPRSYSNEIRLSFGRSIGEEQIGDIPRLLEHVCDSLAQLDKLIAQ